MDLYDSNEVESVIIIVISDYFCNNHELSNVTVITQKITVIAFMNKHPLLYY